MTAREDVEYAEQGGEEYGVDEPRHNEVEELPYCERHVQDPLAAWPALQALRTEYFDASAAPLADEAGCMIAPAPFDGSDHSVNDYLRYRSVSAELLAAVQVHCAPDGHPTLVDWDAFHHSQAASVCDWSQRVLLRPLLSRLAYRRFHEYGLPV